MPASQKAFDIPAFNATDASTVVQVLPRDPTRKQWRGMTRGPEPAQYGFDQSVTPDSGWPMDAAAAAYGQGGGDQIAGHSGEVYVVAQAPTRVVIQSFS